MKVGTKEQILNTTVKLLSGSKDPESITVRDIADAAGVQLAMINYYFRSKDELLYQAVNILRSKMAGDWLSVKDKEKSAYMRFREMLISLCGMSVKYSKYMRLTVEYELTKAEIVSTQKTLPLIREICGDKHSEISIRITAYEIISTLQLIFFRADDISKYLGFDVLEHDRMVEIIDTILANHFPEYKNEIPGFKESQ
jgi:AcrR family transcriptional regulator